MTELPWIAEARLHIGAAEVPGKGSNPFIASLWMRAQSVWQALGADDSSAPWCGQFVDHCLRAADLPTIATPYRARAWLGYGTAVPVPVYGALVIFERGPVSGHVGFVVGRDALNRVMVLGGNQGDAVSVAPFSTVRVLGYRWPGTRFPVLEPLPVLAANGVPSSSNEA